MAGKEFLRFAAIGAQIAARKVFGQDDCDRFILNTLCSMPGAPAKIGQLLGMRDTLKMPSPPPMPLEEVKAIILRECPDLAKAIYSLSDWSKTASLGQTHQAVLKTGEIVAIKVQYPGVAKSLTAQIDAIFGVAGLSPARKFEFDVGNTKKFIGQKLLEETDYSFEASIQNRFYRRYAGSSTIIPKIYVEYSTSRLLTQSWEESVSLSDIQKHFSYERQCQASRAFSVFLLDSIFGLGLIHTDLNPCNYGFRIEGEDVRLVLYDFGSAHDLGSDFGISFYAWMEATRREDLALVLLAMESFGFDRRRLEPIVDRLVTLSQLLLKPLMTENDWLGEKWNIGDQIDQMLGTDKWWFRTAGPAWFLYFMRTIQGWHYAMTTLGSPVNLKEIWFPWERQLKNLSFFMNGAKPAVEETSSNGGSDLKATHLRVLVTEAGEDVVELSLPARAVEDLEELLPEKVARRCIADGIDLVAIKEKAIGSGGYPQELFAASYDGRHYRVWLV